MFRSCLDRVLDCVFPQRCCFCHDLQGRIPGLCDACLGDLMVIGHQCARCAVPLSSNARCCGPCLTDPPVYDRVIARHHYSTPLNHLINRYKFGGQRHLARTLAALMLDQTPWPDATCFLAVPLYRQRHLERGFNQSDELLRAMIASIRTGLSSGQPGSRVRQSHLLHRRANTAAQSGLDKTERQKNIRNAFTLAQPLTPKASVVLIDDVMTTGSTASECARVLKEAGASTVTVWVAARA